MLLKSCGILSLIALAAVGLYSIYPLLFPGSIARARPGQVVIITGSSSGIGADMAVQYGAAGYTVVLAARRKSELDAVAAQVLATGCPGALPIVADLGSAEDCERVVSETLARFGRLDSLVINHAMFDDGLFVDKDVAALDATFLKQFQVNVMGPAYLIRAALPALEAAPGGGRLVEVSSGSTKIAVPFHVRERAPARVQGVGAPLPPPFGFTPSLLPPPHFFPHSRAMSPPRPP